MPFTVQGQSSGGVHVQHQFTITDQDFEGLNIIFESVGGNFPAGPVNATVAVSHDNSTFHSIDTGIALTTGQAKVVKVYDRTTKGATLALAPLDFKYIQITVPDLGVGVNSKVTWSGRSKFFG